MNRDVGFFICKDLESFDKLERLVNINSKCSRAEIIGVDGLEMTINYINAVEGLKIINPENYVGIVFGDMGNYCGLNIYGFDFVAKNVATRESKYIAEWRFNILGKEYDVDEILKDVRLGIFDYDWMQAKMYLLYNKCIWNRCNENDEIKKLQNKLSKHHLLYK